MCHDTQRFYRPVGLYEALLILESEGRTFPPRLPEQPIFYPVLNFEYAEQIARNWNTRSGESGFAGFVTEFDIDRDYAQQFGEHVVGASVHRELWIPSEQLNDFNDHIRGRIDVTAAYYGEGYKGPKHWSGDWYANEMLERLYRTSLLSAQDFSGEISMSRNAVLLNFKYWATHELSQHVENEERSIFLRFLSDVWSTKFPEIHLVGSELVRGTL
jgi:hypothetical protein